MKLRALACWLGALTTACVSSANASVVDIHTTITLFNAWPTYIAFVDPLANSVLIHEGDTVNLSVDFAPGQALELKSTGGFNRLSGWLNQDADLSPPNSSYYTISNISYAFTNLTGSVSNPFPSAPQTDGAAVLGPFFDGVLGAGDSIRFTGYKTSFDVTNLLNGSSYYNGVFVLFMADQLSLVAVPEPAAYALMPAGLVVLCVAIRRRRH